MYKSTIILLTCHDHVLLLGIAPGELLPHRLRASPSYAKREKGSGEKGRVPLEYNIMAFWCALNSSTLRTHSYRPGACVHPFQ